MYNKIKYMEKINVAELLSNCPKGMELDCTMYDNLHFDKVDEYDKKIHCYIQYKDHRTHIMFGKDGTYNSEKASKCVIFPKGKTTWEEFVPPCQFKDGDIIYNENILATAILKENYYGSHSHSYCFLNKMGDFKISHKHSCDLSDWRLATEKEKQKLFQAIKDKGYRWNDETKTLEKLIQPKFKVGDKVRVKSGVSEPRIIDGVFDTFYSLQMIGKIDFTDQDRWELVHDKFDLNTLVPFESRVLIRNDKDQYWIPAFWGGKRTDGYTTTFGWSKYCIPFDGNEHLLNSNKECDEFYRTWEKTGN